MGWGWHGWYMGWMMLFWLAIIILIIWLIVRPGTSSNPPSQRGASAEEILKGRYARGEISREEYQRMLDEIRR